MRLVALLYAMALLHPNESIKHDFSKDELNQAPKRFSFSGSRQTSNQQWKCIQDGDNRVLARRLVKDKDQSVALAVAENLQFRDLAIAAKIKSLGGRRDQNGGLVWRYKDSNNYLLARLDVEDDRVRLYRIVNGNRIRFGEESDLRLREGKWYTLRVEHRGDKIKIYLDDEAIIVERDKHFKSAGQAGLYVNEDAETYFDDFEVRSLGDEN